MQDAKIPNLKSMQFIEIDPMALRLLDEALGDDPLEIEAAS